jgi:hypothetical protein
MSSRDRRAAARRRAWGRGPIILRFEPLEGRQLLSVTPRPKLPDLVGASLSTPQTIDWGQPFQANGDILNQGNAPVNVPFHVEFFVSPTPTINQNSVALGEVTIPAGMAAGQDDTFTANLTLPQTPIPGAADNQPVYIQMWTDPENVVTESNKNNNRGVGNGYDTTAMIITPPLAANLIGTTFSVTPQQTWWGTPITITAQIQNSAQGNAPPTRAKLVLTPAGVQPGGGSDFTIGYLTLPAIPAWGTINFSQQVELPATPPSVLAGASSFTLSMVQDADYVTNTLYPHLATRGLGLDQAQIAIAPNPNGSPTPAPLPDLAADSVQVAASTINWGQTFQVTTGVDNLGPGSAGPFDVRFVLTGPSGALNNAIYLGDVNVNGLGRNLHQDINATLQLPNRLPNGVTLPGITTGRIAMIIDPDNSFDETVYTNKVSLSNPVTLKLVGSDGTTTVPTIPADTTPRPTPAAQPKPAPAPKKIPTTPKGTPRKLVRHIVPKHKDFIGTVEDRLKIFPKQVNNFVSGLIHGKGGGNQSPAQLIQERAAVLARREDAKSATTTAQQKT